jgi:hypothetical protein
MVICYSHEDEDMGDIIKMKALKNPTRSTIIYGLICGIAFVPLSQMLTVFIARPLAICLMLWISLAGYAFMLNRWGEWRPGQTLFPLLNLLPVIFLADSIVLFFILALIACGWIRSGVCYPKAGAREIAVELLLWAAAILVVVVFTPGSLFMWALGTWMFFLIQALYFVFIDTTVNRRNKDTRSDAFDMASKQAERILSGSYFS